MGYAGQTWTDGVTPLDAVHMNALDAGVVGAVDVDNVATAASVIVQNKLLAADAQPALRILGDGKHEWGAGGATAPDTNLYRTSANTLKTDDTLVVNALNSVGDIVTTDNLTAYDNVLVDLAGAGSKIMFGSASDTNLYRSAANELKTDDFFKAVGMSAETGNLYMATDGPGGSILFGATSDTNLYRASAGNLKTNGNMQAAGHLMCVSDTGKLFFGAAADAALYRGSAGYLVTDGGFTLKKELYIQPASGNATIYFGATSDTNLYRSGAGNLKTDGRLDAVSNIVAKSGVATQVYIGDLGDGLPAIAFRSGGDPSFRSTAAGDLAFYGNKLWIGSQGDTSLYRFGANQLKSDGYIYSGAAIYANHSAATQVGLVAQGGTQAAINFGSAGDTTLYRLNAGVLKTDGQLYVGSYVAAAQGAAGQATIGPVGPSSAAGIQFGSAGDTTLYRNGANSLKTDGDLTTTGVPGRAANETGLGVDPLGVGARRVVVGAADSAGAGYRVLRVSN